MNVSRYRQNPVVFYNHDKYGGDSLAIGRTVDMRFNADGDLRAKWDWAENLSETGRTVKAQYDEGIIKAASLGVGFDISSLKPQDNGRLFADKTTMNEWSLVTIPADQNALTFSADFNMNNLLALWLPEEGAQRVDDEFPNLLEVVDIREDEVRLEASLDDFDGDEFEGLLAEILETANA